MLLLTATSVIAAALCAIGAQYAMKLIIDLMSKGARSDPTVWWQLAVFAGMMLAENVMWRTAGWSGSKLVVSAATYIRLDLFRRLVRQPVSYFAQQLSGSLSNRFTACSNAVKGVASSAIWRILPPIADLLGSLTVISIIDVKVGIAVFVSACVSVSVTAGFASRGTAHHQAYSRAAAHAEGRMLDVVTNIWNVIAFGTREREHKRLESDFLVEASAHRNSWMQLEKARVAHDFLSCIIAATLLGWCIASWRLALITAGRRSYHGPEFSYAARFARYGSRLYRRDAADSDRI
jgi:ATP-binding cassette subfamily B protein